MTFVSLRLLYLIFSRLSGWLMAGASQHGSRGLGETGDGVISLISSFGL